MNSQITSAACTTIMPALTGAGGNYYTPAAVIAVEPRTVRVSGAERNVSTAEVAELIEAAGPLSVRDIAGGLGVTVSAALGAVRQMVERHRLREDEWDRFSLCSS
jgi:hypothetical protein